MSLRSILGGSSRVRKSSKGSGARRSSSSASPSDWTSSLPRRKPVSRSSSSSKNRSHGDGDDNDDDYLNDEKLDDVGLVTALATDLNLRDTAQAIQYIRAHMFSPVPDRGSGMTSTRTAEVLNYRKRLPPIVTVSHIQTLLASPSAVERETAELARSGFVRKVVVARRGDVGETLVLAADLERMIDDEAAGLSETTRRCFKAWLGENPATQVLPAGVLERAAADELFRAGFLTAHHLGTVTHSNVSERMNTYSRPEDKTTLVSIENVSKQPAGSLGTTGGAGAVHMAGGSGGGGGSSSSSSSLLSSSIPASTTELRLAIPGNGAFLKLASVAVDHLVSLLGKSSPRFREAPEHALRDRWDGGIAGEGQARHSARRARGEFAGVLPGQTRKWRQFYGLSFGWVLEEAVGSGRVEVFETGSVGRGVRVV